MVQDDVLKTYQADVKYFKEILTRSHAIKIQSAQLFKQKFFRFLRNLHVFIANKYIIKSFKTII